MSETNNVTKVLCDLTDQIEELNQRILEIEEETCGDCNQFATKSGDNNFTGNNSFSNPITLPPAINNNQAVNLGQVNSLIAASNTHDGLEVFFNSPSEQWTWNHGLNMKPIVQVNVGGYAVAAQMFYPDNDTLIINFTKPRTGSITILNKIT